MFALFLQMDWPAALVLVAICITATIMYCFRSNLQHEEKIREYTSVQGKGLIIQPERGDCND